MLIAAVILIINVLLTAAAGAWFFGPAPVLQEFVATQGSWWMWRSDLFWRMRPALAAVAVLLCIGAGLIGWRAMRQSPARWLRVLFPLALSPLLIPFFLYRDCLAPIWLANLIFYFPLFLLAFSLTAWLSGSFQFKWPARFRLNPVWIIGLGASICFFLTGLYYTRSCGAHSGDEGHYLVLATSVYEDHDLDIKNNLEKMMGPENVLQIGRYYLHISPCSRAPHWYSYHSPGLPFLLAPVVPGGDTARHAVLGLIAGLACAAMWLLCRRSGASLAACWIVLACFWFGIYWCVYASRALPEALGACLTAWLCYSALAQKECPWRSAVIAGFCCAYLPWAYIRFLPLALAGLALYPLSAMRIAEPLARRWLRTGLFLLIGLGGIVLYRHAQNQMYVGGFSHEVGGLFLAYPSGLWRVFTNPNGLLNVFPAALWMAAAALVWLCVARQQSWMAVVLLGMFTLLWLATCAVPNYGGGSTLGGRFLVVVMPQLLPAAAVWWDRSTLAARWWLVFLSLVSIALLILELLMLPELGRSFAFPFCELPVVIPVLRGLQYPFGGPMHVLVLFILTIILISLRSGRLAMGLAVSLLIGSIAWRVAGAPRATIILPPREPAGPAQVARCLAAVDLERARVSVSALPRSGSPGLGLALFEVSDLFHTEGQSNALPSVTTRDLGIRTQGRLVSQPRLEVNDWARRSYRWTTLVAPFDPGRGARALYLEGQVEGKVQAICAIREGAATILEQALTTDDQGIVRLKLAIHCEGRRGHIYLLLRLDGDGVFYTRHLRWSPISQRLLDQAGITW